MDRDLYQELILDHNRTPRNKREMEEPSVSAEGHNPLCGDEVTVFVKLDGERIEDISFVGQGCAISTASASLMTDALKGKSISEAEKVFGKFHQLLTEEGSDVDLGEDFEKLEAFSGVRDYPARVKCATLVWHTLHAALTGSESATTE
jgi:nitrogen fixation NifU-like protein